MSTQLESIDKPLVNPVMAKDARERVPLVYDYQRGNVIFPSKRERVLLDAWKRSFNYFECVRSLREQLGVVVSNMTVKRWLQRPHVVEWKNKELMEEARARGLTKAKWVSDGLEMQEFNGKKGLHQVVAWKELGRACGFYEENVFNQTNLQINVTQANGEA